MEKRTHILASFDESLDKLRSELLEMGRVTRQSTEFAVRGLLERNKDFCNQVIADDDVVDQHEMTVDEISMEILLKFRPVARDLRLVVSSMSISRSLERMGDHAAQIAKRSRRIIKDYDRSEVQLIEPLFSKADELFEKSLRSFIDGDLKMAESLDELYAALKKEVKSLIKTLSQKLEGSGDQSEFFLHLIFISRSLQRIGALSVNISEDAVFHESAEDIRHR